MTAKHEPHRKGELTRQRITAEAATIFNRHGYAGTSISDIMRETGMEKGGIYNHFSNKDELALAAFDYAVAVMTERFRAIFAEHKNAVDRLREAGKLYIQVAQDEVVPGGCMIFNTAIEADDTHPELKARAREAVLSLIDTVRRVLEKGKTRGEIRASADSDTAAVAMVSLWEGAMIISRICDDIQPLNNALIALDAYIETQLIP